MVDDMHVNCSFFIHNLFEEPSSFAFHDSTSRVVTLQGVWQTTSRFDAACILILDHFCVSVPSNKQVQTITKIIKDCETVKGLIQ